SSGAPTGPQVASPDRTSLPGGAAGQIARAETPPSNTESHRFRKARNSPAETTTDFFPLMDEDDLESLESAQVVKVELPASVLVAAGLPAGLQTDGQAVTADLVLGQDGLARAIRFVR